MSSGDESVKDNSLFDKRFELKPSRLRTSSASTSRGTSHSSNTMPTETDPTAGSQTAPASNAPLITTSRQVPKPNIESYKPGGPLTFAEYVLRWELYFEYADIQDAAKQRSIFVNNIDATLFAKVRQVCLPSSIQETTVGDIMDKLSEIYKEAKVSVHVHRDTFIHRKQQTNESFADFYTELTRLADLCKFTNREENLVTRIIAGVNIPNIKSLLLAEKESTLTLDFVKSKCYAEEQAHASAKILSPEEGEVHRVGDFKKRKDKPKWPCPACGQQGHWKQDCKFKSATCYKCNKSGHIAAACRSDKTTGKKFFKKYDKKAQTNHVEEGPEPEEDEVLNYLLRVSGTDRHVPAMTTKIMLNGQVLDMEVDTGASFSLIGYDTYKKFFPTGVALQPTSVKMLAWGQSQFLKPLGAIPVKLKLEGEQEETNLRLLVMRTSGPSLVGRNWFKALKIELNTPKIQLNRMASVIPPEFSEFAEVFEPKLGCFTGAPIHLELKEGAKPVERPPRPVPFALREAAEAAIDKLVKADVLEPVDASEWATPVVIVEKTDGTIRLCADYSSTVNPQTKTADYPPDEFDRLIGSVGPGYHFSKIDLADAYLQFRVDEETAELLTINTCKGRYKFKRLPPGLSVAPGVFQRKMQTLFAKTKNVFVYFDDLFVFAPTKKELQEVTRQVLTILKEHHLKVKLQKCLFDVPELDYLGYKLTRDGVKPTDAKIEAITKMPAPENVDQLRSYLGFVNYYNRFIPSKSTIFQPLYALLTQEEPFVWTSSCQRAMDEVKRLLTSAPALTYYNPKQPLRLACDGSRKGLGAVLSHVNSDGTEVPIMHISRSLKKAELNYSQVENEALAVVWAVKRLKKFLWGRPFEIVTDHLPLLRIFNPEKPISEMLPGKIKRYCLFLREFLYQIRHKAGKEHSNADCLSRLPLPTSEGETEMFADVKIAFMEFVGPDKAVSADDMKRETTKDVDLDVVKQAILHGRPSHDKFQPYTQYWDSLTVSNGIVLFAERAVVPKSLRDRVIKLLHHTHFGEARMKTAARSVVWWPGMDKDLEREAKSCEKCLAANNSPNRLPPLPWSKPLSPWSRVHLDFFEPHRGSPFLIAVDASTGWIEVEATKGMDAAEVVAICRRLCRRFGLCDMFVCDNGPAFRSSLFQDFCTRNQIKTVFAPPYSPSTNGVAERGVQTVKKFLKKIPEKEWNSQLDSFLLGYNTTPNPVTQMSPSEKMMGRRLKTLLSRIHPSERDLDKRLQRDAEVVAALPTGTPKGLQVGDRVLYRWFTNNRVTWQPGTISCILGPRRVELKTLDAVSITRHVDQIKPVGFPSASGALVPDPQEPKLDKTSAGIEPKNVAKAGRPQRRRKRPDRYQPSV